uniref:Uncharacterized protein n=1 Tax=Timema genevievae TaxID=629358 RepID=A0A7R9PMV1_TIMGE|nr:unnamed protein product [Timema genevievae]
MCLRSGLECPTPLLSCVKSTPKSDFIDQESEEERRCGMKRVEFEDALVLAEKVTYDSASQEYDVY